MSKSARFAAILFLSIPGALIAQSKPTSGSNSSDIAKSDWATYDRDYVGDRYSPLDEIKAENVTRLRPLCTYDSGEKTSFETGPVVVDGTLFFTTLDTTFAIDSESCKLRWKHTEPLSKEQRVGLAVNRGVAFADGKVFRGYDDGKIVAIDAKSGKAVWTIPIASKIKAKRFRQHLWLGTAWSLLATQEERILLSPERSTHWTQTPGSEGGSST